MDNIGDEEISDEENQDLFINFPPLVQKAIEEVKCRNLKAN